MRRGGLTCEAQFLLPWGIGRCGDEPLHAQVGRRPQRQWCEVADTAGDVDMKLLVLGERIASGL